MLFYKGQAIGGGGISPSASGPRGRQVGPQLEQYKKYAEIDMQRILVGNFGHYKKALDEIDGVVEDGS